jgi:ATPase subunit of ABC transporter with duplicated ATPase domains
MPPFVTLDQLSYRAPDGRTLFENLTLSFGAERTGLVGRNGAGKTTLLRLALGELSPASGSVTVAGRVGVLRQALQPPEGSTVAELLGVAEALARLRRIQDGEGAEIDFAEADWSLESRLGEALAGVGLPDLDLTRAAATLSGGQTTRASLAGLLAAAPDLLVLDEPTNNLDDEARALVADVLGRWRGGALVASHDRELLRRMDRIVELTSLGARTYGGGYDLFSERKLAETSAAEQALDHAERLVDRVARETHAVAERKARRDSAGRRFARSGSAPRILLGGMKRRAEESAGRGEVIAERLRNGAAEQLEAARARLEQVRSLAFELPSSGLPAGKAVLALESVSFAYPGERPVLRDVSMCLTGPERVAVTGPNGSGKTTLIRMASGELAPSAGQVRIGTRAAFLDQQTALLRPQETLVEAFRRLNPAASENAARSALARFLFRNVAAEKRVAELSGGERLRAALACVLMADQPPQLLILDEPTNHLDLDSIAAVEAALAGYDGALLVVSHDPDFLAAIGIGREIALG